MKEEVMTMEQWEKKYLPFLDDEGNPKPFEWINADDFALLKKTDPRNIWTYVSGEGDAIIAGVHIVNRLCYYICKNKWENSEAIVELESLPCE